MLKSRILIFRIFKCSFTILLKTIVNQKSNCYMWSNRNYIIQDKNRFVSITNLSKLFYWLVENIFHGRLTFFFSPSRSTSAFLAHFCQKFGSSISMSDRFVERLKLALAKVDPLTPASIWMTCVRLCRMWSMSSSQNSSPASSSSIRAPYAPFLSRSSISFLLNWFCCKVMRRSQKEADQGVNLEDSHQEKILWQFKKR